MISVWVEQQFFGAPKLPVLHFASSHLVVVTENHCFRNTSINLLRVLAQVHVTATNYIQLFLHHYALPFSVSINSHVSWHRVKSFESLLASYIASDRLSCPVTKWKCWNFVMCPECRATMNTKLFRVFSHTIKAFLDCPWTGICVDLIESAHKNLLDTRTQGCVWSWQNIKET